MIEDKTNSPRDWEDFWHSPEKTESWGTRYVTYEEYQEAKSIVKAYERQANMREQAYYDARAKLDAESAEEKSEYYYDFDRNKEYVNDTKQKYTYDDQEGRFVKDEES